MEKRLHDAALAGDVTILNHLLQEDPLLLDKVALNFEDKNPLHLAAMVGHVDFVKAIFQVNYSAYCYMCLARDRDGRNPLHLAAMYGKLEVLQVLLNAGIQAALEKTDGGGTILHLCVKYNQLAALKMLLDLKDPEFVNAKNEDGMTILHLAIYYNQNQTIKYLVDGGSGVGVNIKNANGKTALDLFLAQRHTNSDILSYLREAEAVKGKDVPLPIEERKLKRREWYEKSRDAVMVVASLIATMAFQSVVSPPGGVWQDDLTEGPNPHKIGEAIMAQTHPKYYRHLVRSNTIAFVSSLGTIILLVRGTDIPKKYFLATLAGVMWMAIATIAITYATSLVMVAPKDTRGQQLSDKSEIVLIVLMVWGGWMITWLYEKCVRFKKCLKIRSMDHESVM